LTEQNHLPSQPQNIATLIHSAEVAELKPELLTGLKSLGLMLNNQQVELILGYVGLLHKWGAVYNLTAIRLPREILVHHVLDCLAIVNPMLLQIDSAAHVLDVGSGAGLPAVMIAVACPKMTVVAVDAVAKKIAFIQQVALQLGLNNLSAQHERVERLVSADYDLIVSRAFSSLTDFISGTRLAIKPKGRWLAMKGKLPEEEIRGLPKTVTTQAIQSLQVPGLNAERCLVWMAPVPA